MHHVHMIDHKEINFFLGIKIQRTESQISLDKSAYLNVVLRKFNMSECNPVNTPLMTK